jgi:hypothetical protein
MRGPMFHVPEKSRILDHPTMGSTSADGNNGAFTLPSVEPGWTLYLICSDGGDPECPEGHGWEHVSVSVRDARNRLRLPTWKEMCQVKELCWDAEDCVVQYHPKRSAYVNHHPTVLHLWRWTAGEFPQPPSILVGPLKGDADARTKLWTEID